VGVGDGVGGDGVGVGVADTDGATLAVGVGCATEAAGADEPHAANAITAAKHNAAALDRPTGRRRNLTNGTLWPAGGSDARSS
jgi:hypothetical protein